MEFAPEASPPEGESPHQYDSTLAKGITGKTPYDDGSLHRKAGACNIPEARKAHHWGNGRIHKCPEADPCDYCPEPHNAH